MATHAHSIPAPTPNPGLLRGDNSPARILSEAEVLALVGEVPPLIPASRAFEGAITPIGRNEGMAATTMPCEGVLISPHPRHEGAPLPSLTSAFSRRRAIFGAVVVAVAPVAALPALGQGIRVTRTPSTLNPADARLEEIADEYEALDREVLATLSTEPDYEDLVDRYGLLEDEVAETPAATMVGVMAKARLLQVPAARECAKPELGNGLADDLVRIMGDRANG